MPHLGNFLLHRNQALVKPSHGDENVFQLPDFRLDGIDRGALDLVGGLDPNQAPFEGIEARGRRNQNADQ